MSLLSTNRLSCASNTGIDALLMRTSTEVLTQILGERATTFLACHLGIRQVSEDDSVNAAAFSHTLHGLLGSGADAIELLILRNIYSKSGTLFTPIPGYSFEDHVNVLKAQASDFSHSTYARFSSSLPRSSQALPKKRDPSKKRTHCEKDPFFLRRS